MHRRIIQIGILAIMAAYLGLVVPGSSTSMVAAQAPSPTPNDPVWLSFDAARGALEEKLERNIQYVQKYQWEEANFPNGMTDCHEYGEDEERPSLDPFFGWRFEITLLNGSTYEVRTSFDNTIIVVCDEVQRAAAQQPAPANPNLNAPVTAPVGPGGLEVGGQVTGLFPDARQALRDAGMTWVKIQATHNKPYQQVVDFINEAHGAGFKALISAVGDPATAMDPGKQDEFAAYVGSLAKAGADAIEVWNEPNLDREWTSGQINGANYTALLAKAYNEIKSNNPNTLVISAAPAPTGFFGSAGCAPAGCNDDVFYQQMAEAGAANYLDCVGVHYNEGIVSPTQNSGDPRDNYPTRYYQANLARALSSFPNKQACITELGYLSGEGWGPLPSAFAWAGDTSIQEHAQWLGEVVSIARTQGNVRLLIIFNINFKLFSDDPQAGYAIIRKDGSCPACATIRAALTG